MVGPIGPILELFQQDVTEGGIVVHPRHGAAYEVAGFGDVLRRCRSEHREDRNQHYRAHAANDRLHATATTRNMPRSMWNMRWQWNAQRPGSSAVTKKLSFSPGLTMMVCL